MQEPRLCVVIPAYNEGNAIAAVLDGALESQLDILVVDDGSTDQTALSIGDRPVTLITHKTNQGKGAAIRTAINWVLDQGYDAALFMDADGQHNPAEILQFAHCFKETRADLIIGSRMHDNGDMPLIRKLSNRFSSFLISTLAGSPVTDSQSGFRMLSARLLVRLQQSGGSGFDFESEMIIDAIWDGLHYREVPISCIYADETSHYHPVRDSLQFVGLVARKGLEKARRK